MRSVIACALCGLFMLACRVEDKKSGLDSDPPAAASVKEANPPPAGWLAIQPTMPYPGTSPPPAPGTSAPPSPSPGATGSAPSTGAMSDAGPARIPPPAIGP